MQNSIKNRIRKAARALLGKDIDRNSRDEIPQITQEEVEEARLFFPMDKFFIFGHARSGTTMLARLVRLHPDVHCNYQAHFFTRPPLLEALVKDQAVENWLNRRSNRWNRGKDLSPVVLRAAADFILERDARKEGKIIVGDKSPNSLMDGKAVRLMHKIYPEARLIYIVRDGRDTVVSHRFQAFIDKPEHLSKEDLQIRSDFSQNAEAFLNGERSIFTEKWIRNAAKSWVQSVSETDRLGKDLYGERYLATRYEDLLADLWQGMVQVWDFLGANPATDDLQSLLHAEMNQNPDADWQKEKAKDIAQSLDKGKQGAWNNYFTDRDRELFQQIAGETLSAWGYEDR